ncbi:hypothetical protein BGZ73_002245 [Actinomortierella ambigua]|nr:hypothetical protein BGZ73_002245 [Actinomortierella ambigua]
MAIPPYSEESTPSSTTTMSEAANEVNAALVAAVTAGEGSGAFTSTMDMDNIEVDKETLESIVAGNAPHLGKRPAEDDEEELEGDSVKLRKLQEEVNNNANAAAQASGILTSTSLSTHTSNHSSPVHSTTSGVETHVPEEGHNDATDDHDTASHGSHQDSPVTSLPETTRLTLDKSQVEAALAAVAAAHPGLETSHQIMADLARIHQIAKIDPTQLASYSTNPNNQATLEQLTSSALANVLAQAPLENLSLHLSQQQQQQQQQQQPAREGSQEASHTQAPAVHGILASIPTTSSPSTTTEGTTATAAPLTTTSSTLQPQPPTSTQSTSAQATSREQALDQTAVAAQQVDDSESSHDEETIASKRAASRNMTNDERRQRRLLRNRMAAKECRKKKKAYVAELEDTVQRLKEENSRLHKEVEELNAKLTLGAMRIDENYRLIQEVEKLNAKLTLGMANTDQHVHEALGHAASSQQQPSHEDDEEDQAEQAVVVAAAAAAAAATAQRDVSSEVATPVTQTEESPSDSTDAAEPNASAARPAMAEFITA